ncbi:hypothetical protein [Rubrivirga sp.]|uniref:hypothetical protein n=1 Tax=Rubrivirga sp. TaxID=1885344 RepID=UPI003B52BACD
MIDIGCGHTAQVAHLPALRRLPDVEAAAVAEADAAPGTHLAACAGIVRSTPRQSRHEAAWTPTQHDAVARRADRFDA